MTNSEHVLDAAGHCDRCGLGSRFGRHCPPGFWMDSIEARDWDAASAAERTEMEKCMIEQRIHRDSARPNGIESEGETAK